MFKYIHILFYKKIKVGYKINLKLKIKLKREQNQNHKILSILETCKILSIIWYTYHMFYNSLFLYAL